MEIIREEIRQIDKYQSQRWKVISREPFTRDLVGTAIGKIWAAYIMGQRSISLRHMKSSYK